MTYSSKNGTEEAPTSVAEMKTNDAYQGKDTLEFWNKAESSTYFFLPTSSFTIPPPVSTALCLPLCLVGI